MTDDKAITLATRALEAQIQSLAVDANMHDSLHYVIPRTTAASKERALLRQAIATLEQMRPRQVSLFESDAPLAALTARCAAFGWQLERADDGRLWLSGNGAPAVFGSDAACEAWIAVQERTRQREEAA